MEGLRVGFYYSLLDWHHPDFTIDYHHPQRENPKILEMNQGREISKYAVYMREQVRELLTEYGPVDLLWFDYSYPDIESGIGHRKGKGKDDWESENLIALVRELAPHVIVNNRLDLVDLPADVYTPEQFQPTEWVKFRGEPVVWEACQTFSGSWGYHRDEATWKSADQLIHMLIDTVSKGWNLLMNVGPTGRGCLDNRALDALQGYGDWMKWHERSIVGCTQSKFQAPTDVRYTQNFEQNRLYVHLFAYPFRHLHLPNLGRRIEYAQFLHDASEIQWVTGGRNAEPQNMGVSMPSETLTLELPVVQPDTKVPVIELFLKSEI